MNKYESIINALKRYGHVKRIIETDKKFLALDRRKSDAIYDDGIIFIKREQQEERLKNNQLFINTIDNALTTLNQEESIIIHMFYIENKRWKEISAELGYIIRRCQRIRDKALMKIKKVLNEKTA